MTEEATKIFLKVGIIIPTFLYNKNQEIVS